MAFISEIHYRNSAAASTAIAEFVEISIAPSEVSHISDFTVATYQSDGNAATAVNLGSLTGIIDPAKGWTIFRTNAPVPDPNHTTGHHEAEAVALIDAAASPAVQTFVDIGGSTSQINAVDGSVAGVTSINIPSASGQSIQFDVHGNRIDGLLLFGEDAVFVR